MKISCKRLLSAARGGSFAAAMTLALISAGCEKEPLGSNAPGSTVRFDISMAEEWNQAPESRSAAVGETYAGEEVIGVYQLRDEQGNDQSLCLVATVSDWEVDPADLPSTRAASIGRSNFYDTFGVLAFSYEGTWDVATCTPNLMYDEHVSSSNPVTELGWPGSSFKTQFFAYAPVDMHQTSPDFTQGQASDNYMALSSQQTPGIPTITYIASSTESANEDLLYSLSGELNGDGSSGQSVGQVDLKFRHALTAINLVSGGDNVDAGGHNYSAPRGTIHSYRITGLKMRGTFSFYGTWSGVDGLSMEGNDYVEAAVANSQLSGTQGEAFAGTENDFIMAIPQDLPAGTTLQFSYTDLYSGIRRTLSADIGGTSLKPGQKVTFHLSASTISSTPSTFSAYILITAADGQSEGRGDSYTFPHTEVAQGEGDNARISISNRPLTFSWWDPASGSIQTFSKSLPWTIMAVEDDGQGGYTKIDMPDWLLGVQTSGIGTEECQIGVKAQALTGLPDASVGCNPRSVKLMVDLTYMSELDPAYKPVILTITQAGYIVP